MFELHLGWGPRFSKEFNSKKNLTLNLGYNRNQIWWSDYLVAGGDRRHNWWQFRIENPIWNITARADSFIIALHNEASCYLRVQVTLCGIGTIESHFVFMEFCSPQPKASWNTPCGSPSTLPLPRATFGATASHILVLAFTSHWVELGPSCCCL